MANGFANYLIQTLALTVSTVIAIPCKVAPTDFRSQFNGLAIQLKKNSPAFSALRDTQLEFPDAFQADSAGAERLTSLEKRPAIDRRRLNPLRIATFTSAPATPQFSGKQDWRELAAELVAQEKSKTPAAVSAEPAAMTMSSAAVDSNSKNVTLTNMIRSEGPIEMAGGAIFIAGRDRINISQEYNQRKIKFGNFDMQSGKYFIETTDNRGELVAEVVTSDGIVTAEGRSPMATLGRNQGRALKVFPSRRETRISVGQRPNNTGSTTARPTTVTTLNGPRSYAYSNEKLGFVDGEAKAPSHFAVRASQPGYRPTVAYVRAGEQQHIPLYNDGFLASLYQAKDQDPRAVSSLVEQSRVESQIVGRVRNLKGGVKDARVVILSAPDITPTYFNGLIPDRFLTATSENGEFVFLNVPGDFAVVQVQIGDQILPPSFVELSKGAVTFIDQVVTDPEPLDLQFVMAEDQKPVVTQYRFLGENEFGVTDELGKSNLSFMRTTSVGYLDAIPENTRSHRFYYPPRASQFRGEIFSSKFIDEISRNDESLVIGHVFAEEFSVEVEAAPGDFNYELKYFGPNFEDGAIDHGVPGGYFAIRSLPFGMHTLKIELLPSKKIIYQTIYAEPGTVFSTTLNLKSDSPEQ